MGKIEDDAKIAIRIGPFHIPLLLTFFSPRKVSMAHPITFKGGGKSSSRGRGASRGKRRASDRVPGRAAFYSTRVEEVNGNAAKAGGGSDSEKAEDLDTEELYTSDDDSEVFETSVKPFNALLQSLTATSRGEPAPKKRRLTHSDKRYEIPDPPHATAEPTEVPEEDDTLDVVEDIEDAAEDGDVDAESVSGDEEGASSSLDTFATHFGERDETSLHQNIKSIEGKSWSTLKGIPSPGWKSLQHLPGGDKDVESSKASRMLLKQFRPKQKLQQAADSVLKSLTGIDAWIGETILNYQDLLFTDRSSTNASSIRKVVCLHALNHIYKTRDQIIKNSARLTKDTGDEDIEYRDQGFTRPKVLFLLPTRQACHNMVETLMNLCKPEQQENKKRFQDAFNQADEQISEEKPEDFRDLFAGNDDDMFRIGIKFTRKTVKYFSQFYNSDIILASPLGLKMAIDGKDGKKKDYDFLSSIEVLVIDQTDALLMQNWEHVEYVLENLNLQPKETHGCDFSRVRNWYLDGHARYLRQSIILTAFNSPNVNQVFGQFMLNVAGKYKAGKAFYEGAMLDLPVQVKQTFSRYDPIDPVKDLDERFKYFTDAIVPSLVRKARSPPNGGVGIVIFINSYMDFVRVRNYFANSHTTQTISFGSISEYTSVKEVARARSHFFTGRHSVLLYTGRAHHFRRYALRGAKSIVLYSLPDNPIFYREIVGDFLATSLAEGKIDASEGSARTIFSKYDAMKLERVVGTQRLATMLRERGGDTFDFV